VPLGGARSSSGTTARIHTWPRCSTTPALLSLLAALVASKDPSLQGAAIAQGTAPVGIHLGPPESEETIRVQRQLP
jgi:hypothetical protein